MTVTNKSECNNCGGTINSNLCEGCGEDKTHPGTGQPRFSAQARTAPWKMGGLLELYPVNRQAVRYIGYCAGGLIAVNMAGTLIWEIDLIFITGIHINDEIITIPALPREIKINIDTGQLIKN